MRAPQNHGRSSEEIREHVRLNPIPLFATSGISDPSPPFSLSLFFFSSFVPHEINSFTLTPPRMRMIVDAFKDTLELGLEKPKQVVVRFNSLWTQPLRLEPGDRLSAIPPPIF